MTLYEILQAKGTDVLTTLPGATLEAAIEMLVENNCGSLVVIEHDDPSTMVGIITERDILRACAAGKTALNNVRVADVMTTHVITGSRTDSVAHTMGLMTTNRIRHLPIVERGRLVGIISIGDVVKAQHHQLTAENHYLKSYIQG